MDPLPAEWRTFGEHPTGAPRTTETAERSAAHPAGSEARSHRLLALTLLLAGALGLLGVAAVAWASQPAEVVIDGTVLPDREALGAPESLGGVAVPAASFAVPAASLVPVEVIVDVEGAVMSPGLQRLTPGMRVGDAIAAAGGFSLQVDAAAAAATLNLAEHLADGAKIHVPARGATPVAVAAVSPGSPTSAGALTPATPPPGTVAPGLIDLNLADSALLDTLPGIGPVTAAEIIAARTTAPFSSVEDLRSRGVVGPATYEGIRALVTVGG